MDEGIVLVEGEDGGWIGLYIDGVLVQQGAAISERDMLELLGCEFSHKYSEDGTFPEDITEFESLTDEPIEF